MNEQTTSGGIDGTLASTGHARGQPDDATASAEQNATDSRGSPTPQRSVSGNFSTALTSLQDPRSATAAVGAANGAHSPSVVDVDLQTMGYMRRLTQRQHTSQQPAESDVLRIRRRLVEDRQRKQQLKEQQRLPQWQAQQVLEARGHAAAAVASAATAAASTPTPTPAVSGNEPSPRAPGSSDDGRRSGHATLSSRRSRHSTPVPGTTASKIELPVTKATLSELDVAKIIHNPKLRHDINYDPELHFRPNLDGEKGRRKQEKAQLFWDNLRDDLVQFVMDRDTFLKTHGPDDQWTLPALLSAVKDIILTLVPARDRELINDGLNVPLLMQQFARGVVDLEKLAAWLSSVLKLHCAPMRDVWLQNMYEELSRGNRDNDIDEIVKGMSSLLSVLECMKLDVANHQIRCLRPALIQDTVNFERNFFYKKMQNGRIPVEDAKCWYNDAKAEFAALDIRNRQAFGEMAVFFAAVVKLILPSNKESLPRTFLFDEDRIAKLRSDMYDAIHLEICMKVYEQYEEEAAGMVSYRPMALDYMQMDDDISDSTDDTDTDSAVASWRSNSPDFRGPCTSAPSSARNSGQPLDMADMAPPRPRSRDFAEARLRSQNLYSCLVALLQSMPMTAQPSQRWDDLWPQMAVEIYRTLNGSREASGSISLFEIEQRLQKAIRPGSAMPGEVEQTFRKRLMKALARRVRDFKTMPNVGLFVVAAGGRIHPTPARAPEGATAAATAAAAAAAAAAALIARNTRPIDPREEGCVEDMATRLAHLGILHWRVWGELAYEPTASLPADAPIPWN